jgi:hypothetical protein
MSEKTDPLAKLTETVKLLRTGRPSMLISSAHHPIRCWHCLLYRSNTIRYSLSFDHQSSLYPIMPSCTHSYHVRQVLRGIRKSHNVILLSSTDSIYALVLRRSDQPRQTLKMCAIQPVFTYGETRLVKA